MKAVLCKIIGFLLFAVCLNSCVSRLARPKLTDSLILQQDLSNTVDKSLYIGQIYGSEKVDKQEMIKTLKQLLKDGAQVRPGDLQQLLARDGGGWTAVTHPEVLQLALDNYLSGPDSRGDKIYWLNRLLCKAILLRDPGIVELLINTGANPRPKDIWESLLHITPDFFPTYETMRLLVEELDFDLYRWCGVTPLWWLVYERNATLATKDDRVLVMEMRKRKTDAGLVCNTERGGGYFLDPEIFPSDKNAWELAECFKDREVLKYQSSK